MSLVRKYISFYDFTDSFPESQKDTFSYEGLQALYNYLENDCDWEIDLDPVALCCEYTEYKNLKELQANYSDITSMEDLQDNTTVIMIDDESFIIADY
jgi:hypothetical protein